MRNSETQDDTPLLIREYNESKKSCYKKIIIYVIIMVILIPATFFMFFSIQSSSNNDSASEETTSSPTIEPTMTTNTPTFEPTIISNAPTVSPVIEPAPAIDLYFKEPELIVLNNDETFDLYIEYCSFSIMGEMPNYTNPNININEDMFNYAEYTYGNFGNYTSRCYCYLDGNNDKICDIPGPTFVLMNGVNININLINNLVGASVNYSEYNATNPPPILEPNRQWPDVSNLHTHGLYINPTFDNVFINVNPGNNKILNYQLPSTHYEGSHWYHAHWNGASNLQINGGLYGGIITMNSNDDEFNMHDIMLQINNVYTYVGCDCSYDINELATMYTKGAGAFDLLTSQCYDFCAVPDTQRDVSGFEVNVESEFAKFDGEINIATINGMYRPVINIETGKWYRLRVVNVNGQVFSQFNIPVILIDDDDDGYEHSKNCDAYLMGLDGILFKDGWRSLKNEPYYGQVFLDPGARADIALQCYNEYINENKIRVAFTQKYGNQLNNPRYSDNITAFWINVTRNDSNVPNSNMPYTTPEYPVYLYDSLNECGDDINNINQADCLFNVTRSCDCWTYETFFDYCYIEFPRQTTLLLNGQTWNPFKPILYLCDKTIYEFEAETYGHPLHFHSSPFQIMTDIGVPTENGVNYFMTKKGDFRDVTGYLDNYKFRYLVDEWNNSPIIVHCHYLPHEDGGMMAYIQNIECGNDIELKKLNPFGYNPTNDVQSNNDNCPVNVI